MKERTGKEGRSHGYKDYTYSVQSTQIDLNSTTTTPLRVGFREKLNKKRRYMVPIFSTYAWWKLEYIYIKGGCYMFLPSGKL